MAIGDAMDGKEEHVFVNHVRSYVMQDFRAALLSAKAGKAKKKIDAAFARS